MKDSLRSISKEVSSCTNCRLYRTARCGVAGEGPADARVVLIGQAPGRQEDETGKPFMGRAGTYLDSQLARIGLDRKDIFITSVVKHFPPNNRTPRADEITACTPYLIRQLTLIRPAIVVLMGKIAENIKDHPALAKSQIIITCHPAAAMRFPEQGKRFSRDFNKLKAKP